MCIDSSFKLFPNNFSGILAPNRPQHFFVGKIHILIPSHAVEQTVQLSLINTHSTPRIRLIFHFNCTFIIPIESFSLSHFIYGFDIIVNFLLKYLREMIMKFRNFDIPFCSVNNHWFGGYFCWFKHACTHSCIQTIKGYIYDYYKNTLMVWNSLNKVIIPKA